MVYLFVCCCLFNDGCCCFKVIGSDCWFDIVGFDCGFCVLCLACCFCLVTVVFCLIAWFGVYVLLLIFAWNCFGRGVLNVLDCWVWFWFALWLFLMNCFLYWFACWDELLLLIFVVCVFLMFTFNIDLLDEHWSARVLIWFGWFGEFCLLAVFMLLCSGFRSMLFWVFECLLFVLITLFWFGICLFLLLRCLCFLGLFCWYLMFDLIYCDLVGDCVVYCLLFNYFGFYFVFWFWLNAGCFNCLFVFEF